MSSRPRALDTLVFGVDVQSGDVRGNNPSYAVVAFDGEHIDRDVVSRRKLLRLIDRETPGIVAIDNVYELAADKDALVHLLRGLPDGTKLVQVTGAEQPESLSRVASRHGVPYDKKPMKEAEAAARLAAANVGQEVSAFTDRTKVKVSRGRSTGKGGWSADRYTRRIHGAVRHQAREVQSALDDARLDYEADATEKYGGYANAVFEVEAPKADVPVSAARSGDVRVEVESIQRDGITFAPLAKRRDHVLVGIDPGTTTAVAICDLDGEVLDVMHTRTADTAEVIEWIIGRGRPVVVAADVTPMPSTVEKIRRSLAAAGWTPESDLPIDEKQHRTREEGYDNDHERDAMAATLFAFDEHTERFERITQKVPPRLDRGEVIARVIAGEESVEAVLRDLTETDEDESEEKGPEPRELSAEEEEIKRLESRVERLEAYASDLEATIEDKDERIEETEDELSEARREERREARERREVARLQRENRRLERERDAKANNVAALEDKLDRLKALWRLDHSNFADVAEEKAGLVPVKPVEKFTVSAIRDAEERFGLAAGDVVFLRDASGAGREAAARLAEIDPQVVLATGGLSRVSDEELFEHDVPIGPAEDVTIQEVDELAVARERETETVIDEWEERAERRRQDRRESMVDRLISEHRADRGEG